MELCNGLDNDCDGVADNDCFDCDIVVPGQNYPTIQDGIGWADLSGDYTVCVVPGTYFENIDFYGANIHLLGIGGPTQTIIDGGGAGTVARFHSGETATTILDGFTLTNGQGSSGSRGGGITIDSVSPTLQNLHITGNQGYGGGGGIRTENSSSQMSNLVVWDNYATDGGGLYLWGLGGGTVTLDNVRITDNTASRDGGGVYLVDAGGDTFTNCIIAGNVASDLGGGVYLHGDMRFYNSVIYANEAWSGGGIYDLWSPAYIVVSNTIVADNSASSSGGGIHGAYLYFTYLVQSYSNVYGNQPDNYSGTAGNPTGTNGNVSAVPLFMDDTAALARDWDLRVDYNGVMIDIGDPAIFDPDGTTSDMGAYGGVGAEFWDFDGDGAYEWWQGNASPGSPWDADDRDASVQ